MKRSPFLRELSRDHHGALSLANRIDKAVGETEGSSLMATIPETFRLELEPHFRREEQDLPGYQVAADDEPLLRRLLQDHERLRDLARRIAAGDGAALRDFGVALREHVRFEERELFCRLEELAGDR